MSDDMIVLTEEELDVVAAGYTLVQTNTGSTLISVGNNNNNGGGTVSGPPGSVIISYGNNTNPLGGWFG